ncbi:MAG: hypothetical protein AAF433_08680 [Bacteroidota bacterium]
MKHLLSRSFLFFALIGLLTFSGCQNEEVIPTEEPSALEQNDANIESISGAEMLDYVERKYGDVSKLEGEQIIKMYFDDMAAENATIAQRAEQAPDVIAPPDVYSTFITATIIPTPTTPFQQWLTFYETTPPIVGLPTSTSIRTLVVKRCPYFFQITTTANAYKNGTAIPGTGSSATRSNYPTCAGRQIRSFARAILYTNGTAFTTASINCETFGPFCLIAAEEVK